MSLADAYGMERSYYSATANPFTAASRLEGDHCADVVVIGGGYTGLHAALQASSRGYSVILLEAVRVGWGASGRNGGQMIPGWRKGPGELIERFGYDTARRLFDLSLEARALTLETIERFGIACSVRSNGHLLVAARSRDLAAMRAEADTLTRKMAYPHVRILNAQEVEAKLTVSGMHGGLLDEGGGHLHPLNYALGLADAAQRSGVRLFEGSPVLTIDLSKGVNVCTPAGTVKARYGVLACDALLGKLFGPIAGRIMPVANYLVATAPLKSGRSLIADDLAVSDSRFVVNYFRMSEDGRLIFGGGERYTVQPPRDIAGFGRRHMLRLFPQLRETPVTYAWGGLVSVTLTRLPHIGRERDLFFAHGYSGQGVLIAALAGKVISEAMTGAAERFDVLSSLAPPEFPGGTWLRAPLYVLGMLWYALRDRL